MEKCNPSGVFHIHPQHTKVMRMIKLMVLLAVVFTGQLSANSKVLEQQEASSQTQIEKRRLVSGLVVNEDKEPLPGLTVRIKGTTIGVITNRDGKYTISIPEEKNVVLIFSFIGKKTKEITYTGQKEVNVTMEEDHQEIEEIVITGYQEIDKRKSTIAVTTIKAEDILLPGVTTIDKMLEGHVPGMVFMQNSGQIGAAPRLRIRGTSTILGTQEPLWVVDGIIQTDPVNVSPDKINDLDFVNLLGNAIAGLNPNDIEQIDVLKDASATALYGTRAANGVIVITTKRGKPGPPSVSYSVSGTYSTRPRYTDRAINMMNSAERIDYSRETVEKGLQNMLIDAWVGYEGALLDYWKGLTTYDEFQKTVSLYESVNTDWFDLICQNAFSHNHTLSLSGGNANIKYYASIGYNKENGVLQKESGERYNANVKVTMNHNKFTGSFGMSGYVTKREYSPSELKLLDYAYNTTRALPAYNPDGSLWFYNKIATTIGDLLPFNILHERDNSSNTTNTHNISLNTQLGYKLTEALKAEVILAYTTSYTEQENYYSSKSFYATDLRAEKNGVINAAKSLMPVGGELRTDNTLNSNLVLRGQINFNKHLDADKDHLLSVAVGGELSSAHYTGGAQTRRGYLPERGLLFSPVDISKYAAYQSWLSTNEAALGIRKDDITNMASGYATVSYSYKNHFTLNANTRTDASNKFGDRSNEKLLPMWSVSGVWNMKENIIRSVNWVNMLSLRSSFGYQGNMLNNVSPELVIRKGTIHPIFNEYQSTVYSFPNPNLKWEKTGSFNASLDFALFKKSIRGSISYYYKKTTDAFLNKNVSIINGINSYTVNKGTLENQGFEVSLNFIPINTLSGNKDGFRWTCDPQLGQMVNKLLNKAIQGRDQVLHNTYTYSDYLNGSVQVVGRPLNAFFSYTFDGLSPVDGRPTFARTDEVETFDKYALMRDKQEVFRTVLEYSGVRVPFIQGGISNSFSYKRFGLNLNLAYSVGSKIRLLKLYGTDIGSAKSLAPSPQSNVRREFVDRWKAPGDEKRTNIPGLLSNSEFFNTTLYPWWKQEAFKFADNIWQMYDNSNIRVVSGNYVKIQNISFSYTVPDEFCQKLYLKRASLSLSGSNVFTWSHKALKGQDPTSQSGSADRINLSIRPSYTFNINVSF